MYDECDGGISPLALRAFQAAMMLAMLVPLAFLVWTMRYYALFVFASAAFPALEETALRMTLNAIVAALHALSPQFFSRDQRVVDDFLADKPFVRHWIYAALIVGVYLVYAADGESEIADAPT